ncbi:hypothetical protein VKT23_020254 [Stygiomarasmius scandens]|uniref:Uncharacterized protein n=1 Tax=Marasmiellus scandens TaxID=2682957 RepID=A0ABR1ILC7_9AGAR
MQPGMLEDPKSLKFNKHLIGYALVSIIFEDLDKGPVLVWDDQQREVSVANVHQLEVIAGPNGENLQRHNPIHALCMAISGDVVDATSLSLAYPFKPVVWKQGAVQKQIIGFAGQHRILCIRKLLAPLLSLYNKLVEKKNAKGLSDAEDVQLEECYSRLKTKGTWIVAFQNKDTLDADAEVGQSIKFLLSTNSHYHIKADTPAQHLSRLLIGLSRSKSASDRSLLHGLSVTHELNGTNPTIKLLGRHPQTIDLLSSLWTFKPFSASGISPKTLSKEVESYWGIVEPISRGGLRILTFLATSFTFSPYAKDHSDIETWRNDIILNFELELGVPEKSGYRDVMETLMSISEDAFTEHLKPYFAHFGETDSTQWEEQFSQYVESVIEAAATASTAALADSTLDACRREVWAVVTDKLDALFSDSIFTVADVPIGPRWPLLCPSFFLSLIEQWQAVPSSVKLLCMSIVPCVEAFFDFRATNNQTTIPPFASYVCAVPYYLRYLDGKSEDAVKWSGSDMPCMTPKFKHFVNDFVVLLLRFRTKFFVRCEQASKEVLKNLPTSSKSLEDENDRNGWALGPKILQGWANQCAVLMKTSCGQDFTRTSISPRHLPTFPSNSFNDEMSELVQCLIFFLELTCFNFMTSSHGTMDATIHKKAWKAAFRHYCAINRDGEDFFTHPTVRSFRANILVTIRKISGFQTYTLPPLPHDDIDQSNANPNVSGLDDSKRENILRKQFVKANMQEISKIFHSFVKQLSREGICGFVTDEGSRLPPSLETSLRSLLSNVVASNMDYSALILDKPEYVPSFYEGGVPKDIQESRTQDVNEKVVDIWDDLKVEFASESELEAVFQPLTARADQYLSSLQSDDQPRSTSSSKRKAPDNADDQDQEDQDENENEEGQEPPTKRYRAD